MKKLLLKLLLLCLVLCTALCLFTACDINGFLKDNNGSNVSGGNGENIGNQEQTPNDISKIFFLTLNVNAENLVGHSVEEFSFEDEIEVFGYASYFVARDRYGINVYPSNVVPIKTGNNEFYIFESIDDTVTNTYRINLRRRQLCTVSFSGIDGFIQDQVVEEGLTAIKPTDTAYRTGYDFDGWDFDFDTPITQSITINAKWKPRNDTPYRVEYYLEDVNGLGYDLVETEYLTGTTDSVVYAQVKNYEHFVLTAPEYTFNSVVSAYGNTVIEVHYDRERYTVTFDANGGYISNGESYQIVRYGASAVIPTCYRTGYTFIDWSRTDLDNVSEDIFVTANWQVNQYTITFEFNNGEEDIKLTQDYGSAIEYYYEPARAGYTFNGWDTSIPYRMPAYDMTITADWLAIFYHSGNEITGLTSHGKSLYNIVVPTSIDGVSITRIGYLAFSNCYNVRSIVISYGITYIDSYAFRYCYSLTKVIIPTSVTSISNNAFRNCSSLTIYCRATSKPSGWSSSWNYNGRPVVWGYTGM
jgi:hypothetical protein